MTAIKTESNGTIEVIRKQDDVRIEIYAKHCYAWIHLTDNEIEKLKNALNDTDKKQS